MAPTLDPRPDDGLTEARLAILAAALGGDVASVYHLLSRLMGEGTSFEEVLFEVLAPIAAEVGQRWHQGDFGISEEHAVTATLEVVVSLLAGAFDVPADAPRLVVACPLGEAHSLPARLLWAYLVFAEWRAVFLGPGYPAADLGVFLRAQRPSALLLSCTMVGSLPGARAAVRAAHAAGIPVLAGGAALGQHGERAPLIGADAWASRASEVGPILESWQPDIAASEAAARAGSPEAELLIAQRHAALAKALVQLTEPSDGPGVMPEAAAHLETLLDALAAAVMLGDDSIFTDFARWQRGHLAAAGHHGGTGRLLDAIEAALHGGPEVAMRLLDGAR